jgi:RNA polymerase sigma-70 factor, ECF subfamily
LGRFQGAASCDDLPFRAFYPVVTPPLDASAVALGLFERHAPAVRRYLHRVTRDRGLAEDLGQEVFLRVVRAAPGYDARERETAWVFRIAQNVVRDAWRRRARSVEDARPMDLATPAPQAVGLDLDRALADLPDEEREALLLAEIAGLSYAEIASATGATPAAVRSRIFRARQALRARLMPPGPVAVRPVRESHDD